MSQYSEYYRQHQRDAPTTNSSNSIRISTTEEAEPINTTTPSALLESNYSGCCAVRYERMPQKFDGDQWKATCFTEQACSNESLYPFASAEEAAFLAQWQPTEKEKRLHRASCKAAADRLQLEATWCDHRSSAKKTATTTTSRIPEAVHPMGCSRYGMSGGSGPYDRLIVFPSAKLAFCGIPKAGITRWIQFLRFTFGAKDYQDAPYYKFDHMPFYFDQLRPEVQREIWNDPSWTRAVLIREPTERLLSAYLDKIHGSADHQNTSFADFVGGLSQPPTTRENLPNGSFLKMTGVSWYTDPHWRPQSYSCGLGKLLPYFDYVGGLDRVAEHTKAILQSVSLWETYGKHYRLSQNRTHKRKIGIRPPEPLEPGQVALGFQQETSVSDHHSRGAQTKIDEYYTPGLLETVKELYRDDYALWEALQVASPLGKVHGKDIAAILNPSCSDSNDGIVNGSVSRVSTAVSFHELLNALNGWLWPR